MKTTSIIMMICSIVWCLVGLYDYSVYITNGELRFNYEVTTEFGIFIGHLAVYGLIGLFSFSFGLFMYWDAKDIKKRRYVLPSYLRK